MKKFCLLNYSGTSNLGDEVQSIAVSRRLPRIDKYVNRDRLSSFEAEGDEKYWLIMNGWFSHYPENWPPSPALRPLPISLHISPDRGLAGSVGLVAANILLSKPFRKYLSGFGPVGARDMPTLKRLRDVGIESYFSGCVTLTLQRPNVIRDEGLLVFNEVPRAVIDAVRPKTNKRIASTTHFDEKTTVSADRFALAAGLLDTYAKASCVITTRLHCALPCVAMGTPVLLLDTASDQHRFDGLHDFVRHCTVSHFLSNQTIFDVNSPPANFDKHIEFADGVRQRIKAFVDAPELPTMDYPLSDRDMLDGLKLINKQTTEILFHERHMRYKLEKELKIVKASSPAQHP
jgi:hypothetical protein